MVNCIHAKLDHFPHLGFKSMFRITYFSFIFYVTGPRQRVKPGSGQVVAKQDHVRNIHTKLKLLPVYYYKDQPQPASMSTHTVYL